MVLQFHQYVHNDDRSNLNYHQLYAKYQRLTVFWLEKQNKILNSLNKIFFIISNAHNDLINGLNSSLVLNGKTEHLYGAMTAGTAKY